MLPPIQWPAASSYCTVRQMKATAWIALESHHHNQGNLTAKRPVITKQRPKWTVQTSQERKHTGSKGVGSTECWLQTIVSPGGPWFCPVPITMQVKNTPPQRTKESWLEEVQANLKNPPQCPRTRLSADWLWSQGHTVDQRAANVSWRWLSQWFQILSNWHSPPKWQAGLASLRGHNTWQACSWVNLT